MCDYSFLKISPFIANTATLAFSSPQTDDFQNKKSNPPSCSNVKKTLKHCQTKTVSIKVVLQCTLGISPNLVLKSPKNCRLHPILKLKVKKKS